MVMDYLENIIQLVVIFISLLLSVFGYIESRKEAWFHATVFFLGDLLSSYFWTAYFVIMAADPNASDYLTYFGWNLGFAALLVLVIRIKSKKEIRYFHPLMLLPIPLNIWQLSLYMGFGGEANSIYQVSVCTAVACFALQGIMWYLKEKKNGAGFPYIQISALLCVFFEFGMWTFSSFDIPLSDLYYPCSFLESTVYLLLVWSIGQEYKAEEDSGIPRNTKIQNVLKTSYLVISLVISFGGILLGIWIRTVLSKGIKEGAGVYVFDIIPVILFLASLVIAGTALAIIMVVFFEQKIVENNRLREATRVAEQSNEAKSDFLAGMSHEIRTPINAVIGMNEMVMRESIRARDHLPEDPEKIRKSFADISGYAVNIESAGNNLLALINDILDLSKIEAGKMEIVEGEYNLSSVLNDVSNMIIFKVREKGLTYQVEAEERLPDRLYGDEVRIRQVITNLLNNAVKYTKEGSVTLSVTGRKGRVYSDGGMADLIISIKDTGIGIKDEDKDRLFGKFERMDLKQNLGVEGTGLGLSITRRLVQLMSGSIQVESTYGVGSVFTVTIPQIIISAAPVGNFREKFEKSLAGAKAGDEMFRAEDAHILVVDDTKMNLMVAEGLLRDTGIKIDTASSGAEAVKLAAGTKYDIILMDQRMPGMDGTQALHHIREREGGANLLTPVICLTADAISGARERYMAEGFTDYLTKPIDSRELKETLIKYLPEDKVNIAEDEASEEAVEAVQEDGTDYYVRLREGGIDPDNGLRYSQGDEDFYRMILREYADSAGERQEYIRKYFEAEDWENYGVYVHALKSSSRLIGADALADAAQRLEKAALEGEAGTIRAEHADMMMLFDTVLGAIGD